MGELGGGQGYIEKPVSCSMEFRLVELEYNDELLSSHCSLPFQKEGRGDWEEPKKTLGCPIAARIDANADSGSTGSVGLPRSADSVRSGSSLRFSVEFGAFLFKGTWCRGITSAPHAEGPGFNPKCVHFDATQHDLHKTRGASRTSGTP